MERAKPACYGILFFQVAGIVFIAWLLVCKLWPWVRSLRFVMVGLKG